MPSVRSAMLLERGTRDLEIDVDKVSGTHAYADFDKSDTTCCELEIGVDEVSRAYAYAKNHN